MKQMSWARQLFYERGTRYTVFNTMDYFTDMNRCVHGAIEPLASWQLEIMRLALVDGYKSVKIGRKPPTFEDSANSNAALLIKESLEWVEIYLTQSAHIVVGPFEFKRPSLVLGESGVPSEKEGALHDAHPTTTHTEDSSTTLDDQPVP